MAEVLKTVTNVTKVKEIDNAVAIWDKLKKSAKTTGYQKDQIELTIRKLVSGKNKIITHAKDLEKAHPTTAKEDQVKKLTVNGWAEASIKLLTEAYGGKLDDKKENAEIAENNTAARFGNFFSGEGEVNIFTVMKATAGVTLGALAAKAGGFSLIGKVFSAMFAFNPVVAVGVGILAVAGIALLVKKVFGPEIRKAGKLYEMYREASTTQLDSQVEEQGKDAQAETKNRNIDRNRTLYELKDAADPAKTGNDVEKEFKTIYDTAIMDIGLATTEADVNNALIALNSAFASGKITIGSTDYTFTTAQKFVLTKLVAIAKEVAEARKEAIANKEILRPEAVEKFKTDRAVDPNSYGGE